MPKLTFHGEACFEDVAAGKSVLDVSIDKRIPHLHQCGGMGRCTTCRIQVLDGASNLTPRTAIERKIAGSRAWDDLMRLGCQARITGDVVVRRLLNNSQDIVILDFEEMQADKVEEGAEMEVAVLFSDIRDFSTYSERQLPFDVLHILNQYFSVAVEPVLNNNGYVDKYLGDGMLAVFGARGESKETICRNAVRAALGIADAARRLSPKFMRDFEMPLKVGIGIHFGKVILGRMGHAGKRQVTIVGDTVNTASRVEGATKEFGAEILVTESVVAALPGVLTLGDPKLFHLKGKSGLTNLYPCIGFQMPDSIDLVQTSFERIAPRAGEFAEIFYGNLFRAHPGLRPLFKGDMTQQSKMLYSILASLVKGLNRMQEIEGGLRMLGKRHAGYGVTSEHYRQLGSVLIATLKEFLAPDFTPEVEQAWQQVFRMISKVMLDSTGGGGADDSTHP